MRLPFTVAKHLIPEPDGDGVDFQCRFRKNKQSKHKVLGKGQFGQVLLIQDETSKFACKVLRKGLVFEGNVIYTPPKATVLRGEVDILRTLRHKSHCLQLEAVYESPRAIYVVTEVCQGGDMLQWMAGKSLAGTDVMRIARQLFTAVCHCDKHGILHRDIKPENIMFVNNECTSDVRLIDFGSGCMDPPPNNNKNNYEDRIQHQTFAGTAFYMAPEIFQQSYTALVDVWSAGVTIYVLVASYPANDLQKAFNLLQKSQRNLRNLPGNDGDTMNDAYFDFLQKALTYWPEKRLSAHNLLLHPFLWLENDTYEDSAIGTIMSWSAYGTSRRHVLSDEEVQHQEGVSSWIDELMMGPWSMFTSCNATDIFSF